MVFIIKRTTSLNVAWKMQLFQKEKCFHTAKVRKYLGLGRYLPFKRLFLVNICYAIKNDSFVSKFLNSIYMYLSININKI